MCPNPNITGIVLTHIHKLRKKGTDVHTFGPHFSHKALLEVFTTQI